MKSEINQLHGLLDESGISSPQVVSAAPLGSAGLIKTDRALAHLHTLLKELQRCLLSSLLSHQAQLWEAGAGNGAGV